MGNASEVKLEVQVLDGEAMQTSSSRAGMKTESREGGRAGLVSDGAGIFPFIKWKAGGAGEVGIDKKAEHFVITMPWAGKVRTAAVVCVGWIQSAGHGELERYCEMTPLRQ